MAWAMAPRGNGLAVLGAKVANSQPQALNARTHSPPMEVQCQVEGSSPGL